MYTHPTDLLSAIKSNKHFIKQIYMDYCTVCIMLIIHYNTDQTESTLLGA